MIDIRDSRIGMMIGLAIGDAMGAPIEFTPSRETEDYVTSYLTGGVHDVSHGEFTDDTSMALAMADAFLTSTIDFDYIKISKISAADYVEVLNEFQKIETKKESALEAKFGKYSDADICAAVKKFGEFKQGRDWVNESHRRKLPCND
jgi:ADP-ribosylglycohydrolase